MIRRTAIALFALVLLSACAKSATTTKTSESTTVATASPRRTTNPKARATIVSPHAAAASARPSATASGSPQQRTASPRALAPSAPPSAHAVAPSAVKASAAPSAHPKSVASAAPTAKATATVTSTPAAVAVTGDIARGHSLYEQHCANCHGVDAQGGMGPSLQNEDSRKNLAQTVAWIKNPALPMPNLYPGTLSDKDVLDIATYVQSLK